MSLIMRSENKRVVSMQKNGYQPKKGNIINRPPSTGSNVSLERKHETSNKYNDIVIRTNKKFIKLIDLVQTSINNPNTDITYDLDLFKDELQEENNRIESEK